MTDRPVLADALAGATVEMLREDAALAVGYARRVGMDIETCEEDADRLRRLAALALAVAEMQERSTRVARESGYDPADVRWSVDADGDTAWFDGHMYNREPQTLPAALAFLLRGAP